jgi:ferric-dicitrate binding protein FerR (iron transport regulator)
MWNHSICAGLLSIVLSLTPAVQPTLATPAAGWATASTVEGSDAWVNDELLVAGASLFPGDRIRTGESSRIAISLPGAVLLLAPQSEIRLQHAAVDLLSGRLQLNANFSSDFRIGGDFFQVLLPKGKATIEVEESDGRARVISLAGDAEIRPTGDPSIYRIAPGQGAQLDSHGPQTDGTPAGEVTRMIPQVQLSRGAQQFSAVERTPIFWGDEIQSGATGRARLELGDGSILSLGSNTSLHVIQHDPASQQTQLDLLYGNLRSKVVKLTRPGSKFEIQTPIASAGIVGTDFHLTATQDMTILYVFEGVVRLTSRLDGHSVVATAGQRVIMRRDRRDEGPEAFTPAEGEQMQQLTDIADEAGRAAAAPVLVSKTPITIAIVSVVALTGIIVGVTLPRALETDPAP